VVDAIAANRQELGVVRVRPLRAGMGAFIEGVDLSRPLGPSQVEAIRCAVYRHKLVIFCDQPITSQEHAAFAGSFGPLYLHPTTERHHLVPTLQRIGPPNRTRLAKIKAEAGGGQISAGYHADTSWRLAPAWAGVLRSIRLPETGGDTIWVDGESAFDDLDDAMKARLRSLHVTHDFAHSLRPRNLSYPLVSHPIVQRHAQTGKEVLWVNFAARPRIVGLGQDDSRALLEVVLRQYEDPQHQFRLRWRLGMVAFWDNLATVHIAVQDYGDFPRLLERALVLDEPEYAAL
jgi:taurine dioxygenase